MVQGENIAMLRYECSVPYPNAKFIYELLLLHVTHISCVCVTTVAHSTPESHRVYNLCAPTFASYLLYVFLSCLL